MATCAAVTSPASSDSRIAVSADSRSSAAQSAAELAGYSAADCAALVREAALTAMRESLAASEVTAAHLDVARRAVRPSLDPAQLAALEEFAGRANRR